MMFEGLPHLINAQLDHLIDHYPHSIKVEQLRSGNQLFSSIPDRFTLHIPYCLDYVKWDIVYNAEFPLAAPDIIFGPEDDNFHPFQLGVGEGVDSEELQNTLSDWNNKDPTSLLGLIEELRNKYTIYQRKKVAAVNDDRLKFEISTILSKEGIEMHMSSGEKPGEVKFSVPLFDMDINKMVVACPWRHQQRIYLQVVYPVGGKHASASSTAPYRKLISTPELKMLFSTDDVKLPPWYNGMCMAEYLPHLEELLQRQVLEAVSLIGVRRSFIEALVPVFGRPLEADPVFCRKATFLLATGPFTFLVHFLIPTQFPKHQPSLQLQSTQHFNSVGVPVKYHVLSDYPWSPRWDATHMAERIFNFMADESLNFKRFCNELQH